MFFWKNSMQSVEDQPKILRPVPEGEIDFRECEQEPIRTPGFCQSYGWMLVGDELGRVVAVSENLGEWMGGNARRLLGRGMGEVMREVLGGVELELGEVPAGPSYLEREVEYEGTRGVMLAHRHGGRYFVEVFSWEVGVGVGEGEEELREMYRRWEELVGEPSQSLHRVAVATVELVRRVNGYDRVLFYHFHEDWTGEVIAEVRRAELTPYLGLRYPATDIPLQARQLYCENLVRVIGDVFDIPARVFEVGGGGGLDMTYAVLRAVSPYHVEYLKNMGVRATLTISVVAGGQLRSMVACHHGERRLPGLGVFHFAREVARRLGRWMEEHERWVAERRRVRTEEDEQRLRGIYGQGKVGDAAAALLFGHYRLETLAGADGAAIFYGEDYLATGQLPGGEWMGRLRGWLEGRMGEGDREVYACDQLPVELGVGEGEDRPCGVMVGRLGDGMMLACFRVETLRNVLWGGDPRRPAEVGLDRRLTPRKSFEMWQETVRGRSAPWSEETVTRFRNLLRVLREGVGMEGLRRSVEGLMVGRLEETPMMAAVLDSLQVGVAVMVGGEGDGGRVLATSRKFHDLFEVDMLDVVGAGLEGLAERLRVDVERLRGGSERLEVWSSRMGPRTVEVRRRVFLRMRRGGEERTLWLIEFVDTTASQRLSDALTAARDQALMASATKSALLANMSHEFKTPLNAILGGAELMVREAFGPIGNERYRKFVRSIYDAGKHLLGLVEQVLEQARLEGVGLTREEMMDLREVAREAVEWMQPVVEQKPLRLVWRVPEQAVPFFGDRLRMRQVFLNLFSNAVKFTPEYGQVRLALEGEVGSAVILEVEDTGVGIPSEALRFVFERFYQADTSTTRRYGGVGLGLSITKTIVELHGGRIEICSTQGRGTRVRVILPHWRTVERTVSEESRALVGERRDEGIKG